LHEFAASCEQVGRQLANTPRPAANIYTRTFDDVAKVTSVSEFHNQHGHQAKFTQVVRLLSQVTPVAQSTKQTGLPPHGSSTVALEKQPRKLLMSPLAQPIVRRDGYIPDPHIPSTRPLSSLPESPRTERVDDGVWVSAKLRGAPEAVMLKIRTEQLTATARQRRRRCSMHFLAILQRVAE
jgi:hypothetical protein